MNKLLEFKKTLGFFVIAIVILIYYAIIAPSMYKSQAVIDINKVSIASSISSGITSLLGVGSSNIKDAYLIKARLTSLDVLIDLEKKFKLIDHYSKSVDPFHSVPSDISIEEFQDFFNKRLTIDLNTTSQLLYLSMETFDKQYSYDVLSYLLKRGEEFINDTNVALVSTQTKFLEAKLDDAYTKMKSSRQDILTFQETNEILTPTSSAQVTVNILASLETELLKKKSELKSLLFYMNEDSLEIKKLKEDIKIIANNIEQEKQKIAGGDKNQIPKSIAEFEELKMKAEFEAGIYKTTLMALEQANLEATSKSRNFTVIQSPNIPSEKSWPKLFYHYVLTTFIALILYLIIILTVSAVREHTI